jgi:hypothetical protein
MIKAAGILSVFTTLASSKPVPTAVFHGINDYCGGRNLEIAEHIGNKTG